MKKLALLTSVLLMSTVGVQAGEDHAALFVKLDTNNNGLVSKQEAEQLDKIATIFDALDENNDGQLSLTEFEAQ